MSERGCGGQEINANKMGYSRIMGTISKSKKMDEWEKYSAGRIDGHTGKKMSTFLHLRT